MWNSELIQFGIAALGAVVALVASDSVRKLIRAIFSRPRKTSVLLQNAKGDSVEEIVVDPKLDRDQLNAWILGYLASAKTEDGNEGTNSNPTPHRKDDGDPKGGIK
ncbi:hypothetical protein [Mycobacterium sp. GA-2829]|uniref:hypothetical protein n=1 Tax=Mycobacterium sp. GA-2829 TaxID=1772283 RepID=UPI0012F88C7B|nr:hypothetical protein [Mycobacterium sp. GA-2829]